jgi:outer membrane protein assembly factor BamB
VGEVGLPEPGGREEIPSKGIGKENAIVKPLHLGLQALSPATGAVLWSDARPGKAGIHWQSPIVVDGRVYVTDQGRNLWAYAPIAPSTSVTALGR